MKRIFLPWIFLAILLSCCTHQIDECIPNKVDYGHEVSQEEALSILQKMLSNWQEHPTKSATQKKIKSIELITYEDLYGPKTRGTESTDFNQIVYLVNFENNQGYAILGADDRILPVISIIDSGYIDRSLFTLINEDYAPYDIPLCDLYCENDGDYMVGLRGQTSGISLVLAYLNYTILDIRTDQEEPSGPGIINPPTPGPPTIIGPIEDIQLDILPMLKTTWGQGSPFNDKITFFLNDGSIAPAGCTTIATLQILAHNQDVNLETFDLETSYSWRDLERKQYNHLTLDDDGYSSDLDSIAEARMQARLDSLRDCIATITKDLADRIDVSYDYMGSGGTFATPQRVLECLRDLGYTYAQKHLGYSQQTILTMLYDNKPVFIAAMGLDGGHAWVIDGVKYKTILDENTNESREQILLHCNWGWNGTSNGFYESRIFDTIDGTIEYDNCSNSPAQLSSLQAQYFFWFRILSY